MYLSQNSHIVAYITIQFMSNLVTIVTSNKQWNFQCVIPHFEPHMKIDIHIIHTYIHTLVNNNNNDNNSGEGLVTIP